MTTPFHKKVLLWNLVALMLVAAGAVLITHNLIRQHLYEQAHLRADASTEAIHVTIQALVQSSIKNYLKGIGDTNLAYADLLHQQFLSGELSQEEARDQLSTFMLSQKIGSSGYLVGLDYSDPAKGIVAIHPDDYYTEKTADDFPIMRDFYQRRTGYLEFLLPVEEGLPRRKALWLSWFDPWKLQINVSPFRDEFRELVDLSGIKEQLAELELDGDSYPFILDSTGHFLLHPQFEGQHFEDAPLPASYQHSIRQNLLDLDSTQKTESNLAGGWSRRQAIVDPDFPGLISYRYIEDVDWLVAIVLDRQEIESSLNKLLHTVIAIIGFVVMFTVLSLFMVNKPLLAALKKLNLLARKATTGDPEVKFPDTRYEEVGNLTESFQQLYQNLLQHSETLEQEVASRTLKLQRSEALLKNYKAAVENSSAAILIADRSRRIQYVNHAFCRQSGYSSDELIGRKTDQLVPPRVDRKPFRNMWSVLTRGESWTGELQNYRKDGSDYWESVAISPIFDDDGSFSAFVSVGADITERRKLYQELQVMATTDSLTGAFNRRELIRKADEEIQRAQRYDRPLSLLLLDIDRFKSVNDQFGHLAGDQAIIEVCRRCQQILREQDLIGRLGGDEFCVMLVESTHAQTLAIAERIRSTIADKPIRGNGFSPFHITCSIGVASLSQQDQGFDSLMARADAAMYRSKGDGRNRLTVYRSSAVPDPDS